MDRAYIKIFNGRVLTPYRMIKHGSVIVSEGKVLDVLEGDIPVPNAIGIDANGGYISHLVL